MAVPTCFPLVDAIWTEVVSGSIPGPVYVEEVSRCDTGPASATAPVVPADLRGARERLQFVVAAAAAEPRASDRYDVTERAGGWLVAPTGRPLVLDVRVDLDPAVCSTVIQARDCLFEEVRRQGAASFWPDPGLAPNVQRVYAFPNAVALADVPLLEALRAIWAPHERTPVGYALRIDHWTGPTGMHPVAALALLSPPLPPEPPVRYPTAEEVLAPPPPMLGR